jgi:alpha-ketoglutarate-dependent taurine dioxygenase
MQVTPLSGWTGALITGVDLSSPLSGEETAAIRSALHKWKVVFFRDHELDHAAQIAFGAQFGDCQVRRAGGARGRESAARDRRQQSGNRRPTSRLRGPGHDATHLPPQSRHLSGDVPKPIPHDRQQSRRWVIADS